VKPLRFTPTTVSCGCGPLLQRHPKPSAAQFAKEAIDPILGASYRNVIVGNDNSSRCSSDWMTIRIQGFCTGSKYI